MYINLHISRLLLAIATIISVAPVFASDGQLEINQACVISTGCFSGDTPGFPVTITQPGSYRLTGNLVIPSVAQMESSSRAPTYRLIWEVPRSRAWPALVS